MAHLCEWEGYCFAQGIDGGHASGTADRSDSAVGTNVAGWLVEGLHCPVYNLDA